MIKYTGNPDDGSGSPIGYGPRLWIKFSDECVRSQTFRDLAEALNKLCSWGGYDRLYLSVDQESDARLMSWEFPPVDRSSDLTNDYSWRWKAAIEYLRKIGAVRVTDECEKTNFQEGFET